MIEDNWLLSYAEIDGIQSVLNGMNRRTYGRSKMNLATKELKLFYSEFEKDFTEFFNELILYNNQKLKTLTKKFNL